jgi:pyrimidine deaminase RibD-like protein
MDDSERKFMVRAIKEARKSTPEDNRPHPKVGVVVVKNKNVIAVAHRGEAPGNHGEFTALESKLGDDLIAGSTVYVTLEPCSRRNPPKVPCAERLIERRVKRVVVGMIDPDRRIHANGCDKLDAAGIEVEFFPKDLADQVKELNRDFIRAQRLKKRVGGTVDTGSAARYVVRPLDEWYRALDLIYGHKNYHRNPTSIFTHLIEVIGGLSIVVSEKDIAGFSLESFVLKALAWWMALCKRVHVKSVEAILWAKFPYVCPYCLRCPHDRDECVRRRAARSGPDWNALKRFAVKNQKKRPKSLGGWQRMFASIYPLLKDESYGPTFAKLTEELGELAESLRVFSKAPVYFVNEAADVFAWLMRVQNLVDQYTRTPKAEPGHPLEAAFSDAYPDRCVVCNADVCKCPAVLEATIVRISEELPTGRDFFDAGVGRV